MRDVSLLVADDEALARAFIKKMLADENAPVSSIVEASNGLEAVELARQHTPDLALLDIRMPGMDGLEAAGKIIEACPGVSVSIITAYDDFDYARTALRMGVEDYLLKPVRPEDVLRLVETVARRIGREQKPSALPKELPRQVQAAMDYVLANLETPLELRHIAEAAFVSPYHLSHLFSRHMGQPMSEFIQEQRLAKAKELLARTSRPIGVIAEQTGFSSLAYFSSCFKKKIGLSPSAYRKRFT